MDVGTALNRQRELLSLVRDAYSCANSFRWPSAKLDERIREAYAKYSTLPRPYRAYVDGYRQCLGDLLYNNSVVIYGGFKDDGTFVSNVSARPDYYAKNGVSPADFGNKVKRIGHYWASDCKSPFFVEGSPFV